jgi:hypothetical protein
MRKLDPAVENSTLNGITGGQIRGELLHRRRAGNRAGRPGHQCTLRRIEWLPRRRHNVSWFQR